MQKFSSQEDIASIANQQLKLPKDLNSSDEQFQKFVTRFSLPLPCKPILHNDQLTLTEYIKKTFAPDNSSSNNEQRDKAKNIIEEEVFQLLGMNQVTPPDFNLLEACLSLDVLFLFCYPNGFDISSLCDGTDNPIKKLAQNTSHQIDEIKKAIDKLNGVVNKKKK